MMLTVTPGQMDIIHEAAGAMSPNRRAQFTDVVTDELLWLSYHDGLITDATGAAVASALSQWQGAA
jgi:hypothetical protein